MKKRLSRMFPPSIGGSHMQKKVIGEKRASVCNGYNLMLQAGLLSPSSPGIYHQAPMLQRSVSKLSSLIDNELQAIGCEKLQMSTLSPKSLWEKTGRWEKFGAELIKAKVVKDTYCLCPTHEEAICEFVSRYASNLAPTHLPIRWYQITNKFRGESYPQHGLLRCREFIMKDLYTFDVDRHHAMKSYWKVTGAYDTVFDKLELGIVKIEADGGLIGGDLSHEYHLLASVGEDRIAFCKSTGKACPADEIHTNNKAFDIHNAIELGHTFYLGDIYSKKMSVTFNDSVKGKQPCQMGCYGLGVTRIVAACIEDMSTTNGMRWPWRIAPYKICILVAREGSKEFVQAAHIADELYDKLNASSACCGDVVLDDRNKKTIAWRAKQANLIGYPLVITVGKHIVDNKVEITRHTRRGSDKEVMDVSHVLDYVNDYFSSSPELTPPLHHKL